MNDFGKPTVLPEMEAKFKEISELIKSKAGEAPLSIEIEFPQPLEKVAVDSACEIVGKDAKAEEVTVRSSCVFIWKWVFQNGRFVRVRCKVN